MFTTFYMFKFSIKFIVIFLLFSNLSLTKERIDPFKLDFPDLSKFKIDLSDLNFTDDEMQRITINNSILKLKEKVENNKELNEETKKITLFNMEALTYIFSVKNNDCAKFKKAAYDFDLTKVFECLNFDISKIVKPDMISDPQFLNTVIGLLKRKTKELKRYNIRLEINTILTQEYNNIDEKNGNKTNNAMIKELYSTIVRYGDLIRKKKLFLEKLKCKDWKGALRLTESCGELRGNLQDTALKILCGEIEALKKTQPSSEFVKRLQAILEAFLKTGYIWEEWKDIIWAIINRDWILVIKYAGFDKDQKKA